MKRFTCYFHFLGWWYWQLGMHLFAPGPNLEIHIPFGFIKIGWEPGLEYFVSRDGEIRTYGYFDYCWHWAAKFQVEEG